MSAIPKYSSLAKSSGWPLTNRNPDVCCDPEGCTFHHSSLSSKTVPPSAILDESAAERFAAISFQSARSHCFCVRSSRAPSGGFERAQLEKKASVPNSPRNMGLVEIDDHCAKRVPKLDDR